jgi:hypothetical protein
MSRVRAPEICPTTSSDAGAAYHRVRAASRRHAAAAHPPRRTPRGHPMTMPVGRRRQRKGKRGGRRVSSAAADQRRGRNRGMRCSPIPNTYARPPTPEQQSLGHHLPEERPVAPIAHTAISFGAVARTAEGSPVMHAAAGRGRPPRARTSQSGIASRTISAYQARRVPATAALSLIGAGCSVGASSSARHRRLRFPRSRRAEPGEK